MWPPWKTRDRPFQADRESWGVAQDTASCSLCWLLASPTVASSPASESLFQAGREEREEKEETKAGRKGRSERELGTQQEAEA